MRGSLRAVAAVALAAAALFVGISLREAVERDLDRLVGRLGADLLIVSTKRALSRGEIARLGEVPGVEAIACQGPSRAFLLPRDAYSITWLPVSENYLEVLQLKLARGREFAAGDGVVAVLGCEVAEVMFGDADPIGQIVEGALVIGVLAPVPEDDRLREKHNRLVLATQVPVPSVVPDAQRVSGFRFFYVRASESPDAVAERVRVQFPIAVVTPAADFYRLTLAYARSLGRVVLAASVALLGIAAVLVAVLLSLSALRRTHEIGIRRSVGARPRAIVWMFIREALRVGLVGGVSGAVVGIAATVALGEDAALSLSHLLVPPAVCAVVLLASVAPALRVGRLAPVEALAQRTLYGGSAFRSLAIRVAVSTAVAVATLGLALLVNTIVAAREYADSMWGDIDERTLAIAPPRQSIRPAPDLELDDRRLLEAIADVECIVTVREQTIDVGLSLAVVDEGFPELRLFEIVEGRDLNAGDFSDGSVSCIVSEELARERGLSVASGSHVQMGRASLAVVGVFRVGGADAGILATVVAPTELEDLIRVGTVKFLVQLRRGVDIEAARTAILDAFGRAHPENARVMAVSLTSAMSGFLRFLEAAIVRLSFLGALALGLSVGEVVALVRFLLVQRAQELGLRRAIGALPHSIWAIGAREAIATASLGVGVGAAAAHALTPSFFRWFFGLVPPSGWSAAAVAGACIAIIGALGSAPARAMVRAQPAELLAQERE